MPRFIHIPPEKSRKKETHHLLDDIIKLNLERIFRGFVEFDELVSYSFKMTRDAEYEINDELDESYLEKMSDSMKQRLIAEPVRFTHDADMPEDMLNFLRRKLDISSLDSLIAGGPHRNFRDFIGFPNVGREYLENAPLPAIHTQEFFQLRHGFSGDYRQRSLTVLPLSSLFASYRICASGGYRSQRAPYPHELVPLGQQIARDQLPDRCH